MNGRYDDMIRMTHHVSPTHPRMASVDRAAQFSPFAALTGYDAAVREAARLTDVRIELTEEEKLILDAKLRKAAENGKQVCVVYFVPDDKKAGGVYINAVGLVKKVDSVNGIITMSEGVSVLVENIVSVAFES